MDSPDLDNPLSKFVPLSIELAGEQVLLHPERALLWPARGMVLVADPHFGKDDIFRRAGIALPRGPAIADLQRLTALLSASGARRLVILGDFVHGATRAGDSFLHAFALWRRAHADIEVDIVAGNHDRRESADAWRAVANWHTRPVLEPPFVFAHHPREHAEGYTLAGHLHPTVRLLRKGPGGRVPVFWQGAHVMVLPSFGSMTGGALIDAQPGDRVYAVAPESVIRLGRE